MSNQLQRTHKSREYKYRNSFWTDTNISYSYKVHPNELCIVFSTTVQFVRLFRSV